MSLCGGTGLNCIWLEPDWTGLVCNRIGLDVAGYLREEVEQEAVGDDGRPGHEEQRGD